MKLRMDALHYALLAIVILLAVYGFGSSREGSSTQSPPISASFVPSSRGDPNAYLGRGNACANVKVFGIPKPPNGQLSKKEFDANPYVLSVDGKMDETCQERGYTTPFSKWHWKDVEIEGGITIKNAAPPLNPPGKSWLKLVPDDMQASGRGVGRGRGDFI